MNVNKEYDALDLNGNHLAKKVALKVLTIVHHNSKVSGNPWHEAQLRSQGLLDKVVGATPIN